MKIIIDTCKQCKKSFTKIAPYHMYCSKECKKAVRKEIVKLYELKHADRVMLSRARHRAKKKGILFDLSLDDIVIPAYCPILGIPLKTNQTGRPGFFDNSPSLDRIDPSKGYTKDNIRVISNRANLLKNNATIEELEKVLQDARCNRR